MLMVDAFLTLATWLPYALYRTITLFLGDYFYDAYSWHTIFVFEEILFTLMMTNMFSTPIVYFVFNKSFRVS